MCKIENFYRLILLDSTSMFPFTNQQLHFESDKDHSPVCFCSFLQLCLVSPKQSEEPKYPLPLENIIF